MMKTNARLNLLEWALRINVFSKLFIYGVGKIVGGQFYLRGAIPKEVGAIPLSETSSYDLAWTFFGHSQGYILVIGISQLVAATLFLLPKTKLVGGLLLIPILLNIILVDIFYKVAYGALFSACFYLASVFVVLYLNRGKVITAMGNLLTVQQWKVNTKQRMWNLLWIAIAFVLLLGIEFTFIGVFGYENP